MLVRVLVMVRVGWRCTVGGAGSGAHPSTNTTAPATVAVIKTNRINPTTALAVLMCVQAVRCGSDNPYSTHQPPTLMERLTHGIENRPAYGELPLIGRAKRAGAVATAVHGED